MPHTSLVLGTILGVFLFVRPTYAAPLQNEYAIRAECSGAYLGPDVHDCVEKRAKESSHTLLIAEKQMRDAIRNWGEDKTYIKNAKRTFETTINDFATYRATQCNFYNALNGGGTGYGVGMRQLACIAALNNQRAADLIETAQKLPQKQTF